LLEKTVGGLENPLRKSSAKRITFGIWRGRMGKKDGKGWVGVT